MTSRRIVYTSQDYRIVITVSPANIDIDDPRAQFLLLELKPSSGAVMYRGITGEKAREILKETPSAKVPSKTFYNPEEINHWIKQESDRVLQESLKRDNEKNVRAPLGR